MTDHRVRTTHGRADALDRRPRRDVRRVRRQDVLGPDDRSRPLRPVRRLVRGRPDGTTIELTIDADSLDTGHATRDKHLRSTDFFHVVEHPQVRFTSTRVHHVTDEILHVVGHLEAAGKVVPLEFAATVRAARRRARDRGDDDGRPAAARDEQRPARDDPPAGDAARQGTAEPMTARHRVVIVGGGFGGLAAAKALRRAPVDVTLVDRQAHHLFQPLLYQVATGRPVAGERRAAAPGRPAPPAQRGGRPRRGRRRRPRAPRRRVQPARPDVGALLRQPDRRRRLGAVVLRPRRVRRCTPPA